MKYPSIYLFPDTGLVGFCHNSYVFTTIHNCTNKQIEAKFNSIYYGDVGDFSRTLVGRNLICEIFRRMMS